MSWWRAFAVLVSETVRSATSGTDTGLDSVGATAPPVWWLADGEECRAKNPTTFEIPDRARRYSLRPGDLAKLMFLGEKGGDRMWVQITSVNITGAGALYRGELRNNGTMVGARWGAPVEFDPKHVIDIEKKGRA